jgi:drug/metabolite transporter (DMT)-like permease
LVLFFGVLAVSASAILIRLAQAEAPSLVIAAWRLSLATLFLLPLALWRRRGELRRLPAADWRLCVVSGVMLGIHFATWISSLAYTSVATSTVLVATMPLRVALAAPLALGEGIDRPVRIAIGLALLGSVLIVVDDAVLGAGVTATPFTGGRRPLLGGFLALLGAVSGAVYILIGRRVRATLSVLSYITVVYGAAAIFLVALALLAGHSLFGYSPTVYGLVLLMALFPQLLGHTSYNWALGYLPAAFVTITVISEPIGASVLALFLFGEIPGAVTLVGSAVILGALVLAQRRPRGTTADRGGRPPTADRRRSRSSGYDKPAGS